MGNVQAPAGLFQNRCDSPLIRDRRQGPTGTGAAPHRNSFPKVSPDGRWIVFVEAHNGLLMRPDGQLYIVPFEGGKARRLRATSQMD